MLLAAAVVAVLPETAARRPGGVASLIPRLGAPARIRTDFYALVPILVATWALGGLYRQVRDAILDGRLGPGERVAPTRDLARQLGVAGNTVASAYDRLTAEGFLAARVGAGTYVRAHPPARQRRSRTAPPGRDVGPRPLWHSMALPSAPGPVDAAYDFSVGVPDPELFPLDVWRRLVTRELRAVAVRAPAYTESAGLPRLREAIARHVGLSRSVRAAPHDVIVTNGAQQALDLIGRVLVEPGACVAVEDPGYWQARLLFASLGAQVLGVPVDEEGLDVSAIPGAARLVYATPSHQYPLGTPMSLTRRLALLDWAERRGGLVIEDDYDSEFRFSDRPLEPLQSLDAGGRVLYVGSFSKTMLPMLRLGYLIAPASLQPALIAAKRLTDRYSEPTVQAAMAQFIEDGLLGAHIRKVTREYAARHEQILRRLELDYPQWLEPVPSATGLHLSARLRPGTGIDLTRVLEDARAHDVLVTDLAGFYDQHPAQPGLVIGYGLADRRQISMGLDALAAAFRRHRR